MISREAARRHWPASSPLGQRIQMLDGAGRTAGEAIEIVGVVDDVKGPDVVEPPPPRLYRPLAQAPLDTVALAVRATGDPASVAGAIRQTLRAMDRDLAVADVETMDTLVRAGIRNTQMVLALFASFAGVALVLALTGVYGVACFSVGQRRHELGVRVALGATAGRVARMILAGSLRLIAIGAALGIAAGWAISLTMGSVLFGVSATDPATYLVVLALLGASAAAASLVPAQRAMSIDPVSVLKRE
jgi:putative ABC transport system permease protein